MWRIAKSLVLVGMLELAGCANPFQPENHTDIDYAGQDIIGSWTSAKIWLDSASKDSVGYFTIAMRFAENGVFVSKVTTFGTYEAVALDQIAAWSQTIGTFRLEGNKLTFSPEILMTWDGFYGQAAPQVQRPYPYGGFYDDCSFEIDAETLALTYLSYPADAPVLTRQTFHRSAPGRRLSDGASVGSAANPRGYAYSL